MKVLHWERRVWSEPSSLSLRYTPTLTMWIGSSAVVVMWLLLGTCEKGGAIM